ncbi:MAG: histidine phosphatase family protein [Pegethrix bostrychoides GSE-TBD4-15B]|jgi:broad specificity phosphatase PhoE|uniref:Histidine phosphatase family protein n=1 Tax=Pegethrix bostrychoides GSE-TBD4-15B TaxID=2839662 RepID=A0A951PDB8_9CYAN|nr:histidine phosphatase family protein [Pegethrix bostrychoides GSE-TBD4-15B]
MANVWLIRHGESEANAGLPTESPTKTPLTELGHRQAEQVAQAFNQAPDLIITSPYWRTQQTAAPTRVRFPQVPHQVWHVQEFTYLAPDRYVGSTIAERLPHSDRYWQHNDPLFVDGAGAESFADLVRRAQAAQAQIQSLKTELTAIFSHGRFIRVLLWVMLTRLATGSQISARQMRQFQNFINAISVPNGSILKLQVDAQTIWLGSIEVDHLQSHSSDIAKLD